MKSGAQGTQGSPPGHNRTGKTVKAPRSLVTFPRKRATRSPCLSAPPASAGGAAADRASCAGSGRGSGPGSGPRARHGPRPRPGNPQPHRTRQRPVRRGRGGAAKATSSRPRRGRSRKGRRTVHPEAMRRRVPLRSGGACHRRTPRVRQPPGPAVLRGRTPGLRVRRVRSRRALPPGGSRGGCGGASAAGPAPAGMAVRLASGPAGFSSGGWLRGPPLSTACPACPASPYRTPPRDPPSAGGGWAASRGWWSPGPLRASCSTRAVYREGCSGCRAGEVRPPPPPFPRRRRPSLARTPSADPCPWRAAAGL